MGVGTSTPLPHGGQGSVGAWGGCPPPTKSSMGVGTHDVPHPIATWRFRCGSQGNNYYNCAP